MPPTSLVRLAVVLALAATHAVAQAQNAPPILDVSLDSKPAGVSRGAALVVTARAVSYTHLTLPTKRIV